MAPGWRGRVRGKGLGSSEEGGAEQGTDAGEKKKVVLGVGVGNQNSQSWKQQRDSCL